MSQTKFLLNRVPPPQDAVQDDQDPQDTLASVAGPTLTMLAGVVSIFALQVSGQCPYSPSPVTWFLWPSVLVEHQALLSGSLSVVQEANILPLKMNGKTQGLPLLAKHLCAEGPRDGSCGGAMILCIQLM